MKDVCGQASLLQVESPDLLPAAPVVSARGLGVWRGDDGAGAADVEVCLVVGEHDGVLLLREPGPRRLPVELLAQVPRGGHIVGEETPGSVLRKKKKDHIR